MDYTRSTIAGSYLEHDASVVRFDACVRTCVHAGFLGVCADGGIYTGSQIAAYYRGPVDKVGLETTGRLWPAASLRSRRHSPVLVRQESFGL